jgi:hypothetical protein
MTERSEGTKYESTKGLTVVQVAALIRADIKAAVAAGELPEGKYSVRTQVYSGGASLSVRFIVPSIRLFNAAHLAWEAENAHSWIGNAPAGARDRDSAEARELTSKLEVLVDAYNYRQTDWTADYCNCRFFARVEADHAWEGERRAMEREAATTPREVEEPAQVQWLAAMGAL